MVFAQQAQALGDIELVEPFHLALATALYSFQSLRRNELNGAGAILSDMGDQGKGIARRNLKLLSPALQYNFIVGEKPPQEGVDCVRAVLFRRRGMESDKG